MTKTFLNPLNTTLANSSASTAESPSSGTATPACAPLRHETALPSLSGPAIAPESTAKSRAPAPTVAVAMSGGVDSATVAAILHDRGQPMVGLTMQLWNLRRLPQEESATPAQHRCCSIDDVY